MIELGVQVQKTSFACSLKNDVKHVNIPLANIQFISYLCCSVRITLVGHYHSLSHLCESYTVQVILFLSAYWLKCYAVQSEELTPPGFPIENVPGLQVYWHPFVCQFLTQLESQIDLVSLFLYKNVRQCYVKPYRILHIS